MIRPISDSTANPAGRLKIQYNEIMAIDDVDALKTRALGLVAKREGISELNARKFEKTVHGIKGRGRESALDALRGFLTNFMLRADGMGVI